METPKYNVPESLIPVYIFIIWRIIVYLQSNFTSENLYFYLFNTTLIIGIMTLLLIVSFLHRLNANMNYDFFLPGIIPSIEKCCLVHYFFLVTLLMYSILTCLFWDSDLFYSGMDIFYILEGFSIIVLMLLVGFEGLRYLVEYLTRLYPLRRFSRLIYGSNQDFKLNSEIGSLFNVKQEFMMSSFIIYACILVSFIFLSLPYVWPSLYEHDSITSHIQVEMNGAYIKNETISVPVKISGLDRGLSVTLSKVNSKNLQEVSSLIFYSNDSSPHMNNTLVGKANGAGSYHFFLNTTKMSPGYYELKFEDIKYKQIHTINCFSLS